MSDLPCTNTCPECIEFEQVQRQRSANLEEEILKLRTGLARLAFKLGLAEHVPGKPGREAPFEVLEKSARAHPRGWNALIGVMMDEAAPKTHVETLRRYVGEVHHAVEPVIGMLRMRPDDALKPSADKIANEVMVVSDELGKILLGGS